MSTIEERVARGAAWLDDNVLGWQNRIDLDRLDMGNRYHCVLGQLYGNYMFGPLARDEAQTLGLQRTGADGYAHLEVEWRRVITERRAAA